MSTFVGTSGWRYDDWRRAYYPPGLPPDRWFERLLADFRTVELNVSFYRLPPRATFEGWRQRSPADAIIAVKASRYLTHVRRLRDPEEPVARLMDRALALGDRLGPVLVQLPPTLAADRDLLATALRCFPDGVRLAVEPRHASWFSDDIRRLLTGLGAALVWADRRGRPVTPLWRTAPWGYVRLHEGRARPWPSYGRRALARWAARIAATYADDQDVFVYFNNDPGCAAVDNAITFAHEVARLGRSPSRVPRERPRHQLR
jgi:uncharacterized protein YecE (DUF72 family)